MLAATELVNPVWYAWCLHLVLIQVFYYVDCFPATKFLINVVLVQLYHIQIVGRELPHSFDTVSFCILRIITEKKES